jgi:hypothetical protein
MVTSTGYGWSIRDGVVEGFSSGGTLYLADGTERPSPGVDHRVSMAYQPTGSIEHWRAMSKVITDQRRSSLDVILASGLAGPLAKITGHDGLVLAAVSDSGTGKTTALRTAQAIWGHPKHGGMMLNDTDNSTAKKMGALKHLPLYYDEVQKVVDAHKLVAIIFQATQGREKNRLNTKAELKEAGDWQTLMVACSNHSLLDLVASKTSATTAGIHRLFEFWVEKPTGTGRISVADATVMLGRLLDNYGHAGIVYAKFLAANYGRLEIEVTAAAKEFETNLQLVENERYWGATAACIWCGAKYGNELGLTDIPLEPLKKFLYETVRKLRIRLTGSKNDLSQPENVAEYISNYLDHIGPDARLVTDIVAKVGGRRKVSIKNSGTLYRSIYAHIATDDKIMRINCAGFNAYLEKQGIQPSIIEDSMMKTFNMKIVKVILGGGTRYSTNIQAKCYELDLTHPELVKLIDL